MPLDPIPVGAYEGGYALRGQCLDPRSARFHAEDQEFGQPDPLSLGEPVAIAQEA